jgi:LysM repeat protein
MTKSKWIIWMLFLFTVAGFPAYAQNAEVMEYINTYKEVAIKEMQRTGVPATITLAQGILESGAGRSDLAKRSNNHFGIKCKSNWTGEKVYHDDDAAGECFRKYPSGVDSYIDHSNFLRSNGRYASLFNLDPTDYKGWAYGLKKAGYATEARYAEMLVNCVENYNLHQYSLIALGKMQPGSNTPGQLGNDEEPKEVYAAVQLPRPAYPAGIFTINDTRVLFATKGTSLLSIAEEQNLDLIKVLDFNDLSNDNVLAADQLIFLQRKRKKGDKPYHKVAAGENLYYISQVEGIRLESLCEYNKLERNMQPAVGELLSLQSNNPSRVAVVNNPAVKTVLTDDDAIKEERAPVSGGEVAYMKKEDLDAYRKQIAKEDIVMEEQKEVPVYVPVVKKEAPKRETVKRETKSPVMAKRLTPKTHRVQPKETLSGIAKKYAVTTSQLMSWNKLTASRIKPGQALIVYK